MKNLIVNKKINKSKLNCEKELLKKCESMKDEIPSFLTPEENVQMHKYSIGLFNSVVGTKSVVSAAKSRGDTKQQ